MILIELETGAERIFGSPGELAEAIRDGVVGAGARIYHRATEQWLPISVHPAFRNRSAAAHKPLPPLSRKRWTFFDAQHGAPDSHPAPHAAEPEVTVTVKAEADQAPPDGGRLRRAWRTATRYLRSNGKPASNGNSPT